MEHGKGCLMKCDKHDFTDLTHKENSDYWSKVGECHKVDKPEASKIKVVKSDKDAENKEIPKTVENNTRRIDQWSDFIEMY